MPLVKSNLFGLLCAIIAATAFATSLITARSSFDHGSNVQTVMVLRFILLAVLMLLWNLNRGIKLKLPRRQMLSCWLLGLTYFVGIGSYLMSVSFIPVSLAVIIFYTFPILVALFSAVLAKRLPNMLELLAPLIAFLGLSIALNVETGQLHFSGLMFAVFASIGVTLNMIGSSYLLKNLSTSVFSFHLAISVCLLAALALLFGDGLALPHGRDGWLAFAMMLLSFTIGFIAVYTAIQIVGPVRTATVLNMEPIVTILLAVLLLGEHMTNNQIFGGSIVFCAILLAQYKNIRSGQKTAAISGSD